MTKRRDQLRRAAEAKPITFTARVRQTFVAKTAPMLDEAGLDPNQAAFLALNPRDQELSRLAKMLGIDGDPPMAMFPWPGAHPELEQLLGAELATEILPPDFVHLFVVESPTRFTQCKIQVPPTVVAPFPVADPPSPLEEVLASLFDAVPSLIIVFGIDDDGGALPPMLSDLPSSAAFADANLPAAQRAKAAPGLYPLFFARTSRVLERNIPGERIRREFNETCLQGNVTERMWTGFASADVHELLTARFNQMLDAMPGTEAGRRGRRTVYLDAKRGQRIAWVVLGRAPIPAAVPN
jgi:hypothetical protein